jgi:putative SOS response-associated peptidase YedK
MCARYSLFQERLAFPGLFEGDGPDWTPNYNITPSTYVPVVFEQDEERTLHLMEWGLVPAWVKDYQGVKARPVNARSETASEKPYFRTSFKKRRCILPMSGFFEWKAESDGTKVFKQPYYVSRTDGGILAAAGLWDIWDRGEPIHETCTILTTDANPFMARLHDRMPCFLEPDDYDSWLDADLQEPAAIQSMLSPLPEGVLRAWPVTRSMSNPRYKSPESIVPISA